MGLHFNCQKAPFNGAPDVKVEGIILDEGGDSLPFANIYLTSNTDMGTSSDFNGEFELTVPMGSNISISFIPSFNNALDIGFTLFCGNTKSSK